MPEILHIIFNEDISGDKLGDKFSERLDKIKIPYLQVKDLYQFELLLSLLPEDQQFYLWVHPNNSLKQAKNLDSTNQEDIAFTLKRNGRYRFNLVTRVPSPQTAELAQSLGVSSFKIAEMWDISRKQQPLTVSEINGLLKQQHFNYKFAIVSALFKDEHKSLYEFLDKDGRIA